jgi:hypothetical protein
MILPNPDKPEPKIFATLRHKAYIYYSFFVPWWLSGNEKSFAIKNTKSIAK